MFDILWLDGRDVTSLPLDERRALLGELPLQPPLAARDRARRCRSRGSARAAKAGKASSPSGATRRYEHRRSPHWLKMKCEATQELVVGGFTDPQGGRVGLGALLVGYFEQATTSSSPARSAPASTRSCCSTCARGSTRSRSRSRRSRRPIGLPRLRAHWVRPEIVVQVAFIEWTVHGKLRHPRLLGVRTDKAAREVVQGEP